MWCVASRRVCVHVLIRFTVVLLRYHWGSTERSLLPGLPGHLPVAAAVPAGAVRRQLHHGRLRRAHHQPDDPRGVCVCACVCVRRACVRVCACTTTQWR